MAVHDTEDCPRRNNSVHLNSVQRVCVMCAYQNLEHMVCIEWEPA